METFSFSHLKRDLDPLLKWERNAHWPFDSFTRRRLADFINHARVSLHYLDNRIHPLLILALVNNFISEINCVKLSFLSLIESQSIHHQELQSVDLENQYKRWTEIPFQWIWVALKKRVNPCFQSEICLKRGHIPESGDCILSRTITRTIDQTVLVWTRIINFWAKRSRPLIMVVTDCLFRIFVLRYKNWDEPSEHLWSLLYCSMHVTYALISASEVWSRSELANHLTRRLALKSHMSLSLIGVGKWFELGWKIETILRLYYAFQGFRVNNRSVRRTIGFMWKILISRYFKSFGSLRYAKVQVQGDWAFCQGSLIIIRMPLLGSGWIFRTKHATFPNKPSIRREKIH